MFGRGHIDVPGRDLYSVNLASLDDGTSKNSLTCRFVIRTDATTIGSCYLPKPGIYESLWVHWILIWASVGSTYSRTTR